MDLQLGIVTGCKVIRLVMSIFVGQKHGSYDLTWILHGSPMMWTVPLIHIMQDDGSYGCPVPTEEQEEPCDMPECTCYCPV